MKPLLYFAASLMIGASIYGFVDYSDARQSREFKAMYHEEEDPDAVEIKKIESTETERSLVRKEGITSKVEPALKEEIVPAVLKKAKKASKKINRKKKINYKSFSRAPLREENPEYDPELKTEVN
jgi:hypothetical protein